MKMKRELKSGFDVVESGKCEFSFKKNEWFGAEFDSTGFE
jgi:hypothetical protein